MSKLFAPIAIVLLILPLAAAANLDVEILKENPLILVESNKTASFTLLIKNNENVSDSFEIYSLAGVSIRPSTPFNIPANSEIELEIVAIPHEETKRDFRGAYIFEYQIKGKKTNYFYDRLTINIIELKDSIKIVPKNILFDDSQATFTLNNLENFDFDNLKVEFKSPFFDFSKRIFLPSFNEATILVPILNENIKGLSAGDYQADVTLTYNNKIATKKIPIKFLEKEGVIEKSTSSGIIIKKTTKTTSNEGNVDSTVTVSTKKDIISRLFTTHSEDPQSITRKNLFVTYIWEEQIPPGEILSITTTTNYTIPFIITLIIIIVIILAIISANQEFILKKRISFMKTKGGEFALKVKLKAKSKKHLTDITITDRLPRLTKLYNKFGIKPDKINHETRTITWNLKSLNAGEERTFTYVIYSKVQVLGRFELPSALATFHKNGVEKEIYSNKTSYIAEDIQHTQKEE